MVLNNPKLNLSKVILCYFMNINTNFLPFSLCKCIVLKFVLGQSNWETFYQIIRESIQQPRYLILDQDVRLTNKQPTYLSVPNANLAAICVTNMTIMSLQGAMYSILLHFIVVPSRRCLPVQRSWFFIIQIILGPYWARLFVIVPSSRFLMTLE